MTPGKGISAFHNQSVRPPWGLRCRKLTFSGHPKTTFRVLAMVIRIVMTIASKKMTISVTPKTGLGRAENRSEKGAKYSHFVKGCYFCGPHHAPKRSRGPRKQSWFDKFFRKLRPEKWALRLYIYTFSPRFLHKYTAGCKGFSPQEPRP